MIADRSPGAAHFRSPRPAPATRSSSHRATTAPPPRRPRCRSRRDSRTSTSTASTSRRGPAYSPPRSTASISTAGGSRARHLDVEQLANAPNQQALILQDGSGADLIVRNVNGAGGKACTLLGSSILSNAPCEATGNDGRGVFPYRFTAAPVANTSSMRNITAVATGTGGVGILAIGGLGGGDEQNLW